MGFAFIMSGVSVLSFWLTMKTKQIGDAVLGPTSAYKGFNLSQLTAPKPSGGAFAINIPFLVAVVGLLFGAGYLLRGVSSVLKG